MSQRPKEFQTDARNGLTEDESKEQPAVRERSCLHYGSGVQGQFYGGEEYLRSLQRLTGSAAMKIAQKVSPFFWIDAPRIQVWLCRECAVEVGLINPS